MSQINKEKLTESLLHNINNLLDMSWYGSEDRDVVKKNAYALIARFVATAEDIELKTTKFILQELRQRAYDYLEHMESERVAQITYDLEAEFESGLLKQDDNKHA